MDRRKFIATSGVGVSVALGRLHLANGQAATPVASPAATPVAGTPGQQIGIHYGSPDHPFAPDSLWNSVPINPSFDDWQIPDTDTGWYPQIDDGDYSIGVYIATENDPPQVITGLENEGVWDPDSEVRHPSVTLPHFPADTLPPDGTDGSIVIHDTTTGIMYSFWQIRKFEDGSWHAEQMSWANQSGSGWPDPVHYFQGASAAGTPNGAGLIRRREYNEFDEEMYYHALTMTLDFTGLADSGKPSTDGENYVGGYTFPATSADGWGPQNSGVILQGSLMMLPADFDVDALPSRELRKVARTLQTYGAYVVDRNWSTPFTIGVQLGIDYELGDEPYNDPDLDDDADWATFEESGIPQGLQQMQYALRLMTDCDGYLTADGKVIEPVAGANIDLLSMRGPWEVSNDSGEAGAYNTFTQRLEFTDAGVTQTRNGRWQRVDWALLQPGEDVRFLVHASGRATLQLQAGSIDTAALGNGEMTDFVWPDDAGEDAILSATSGDGNSWVKGTLYRLNEPFPIPEASPIASPAS